MEVKIHVESEEQLRELIKIAVKHGLCWVVAEKS